jgi:hypothetical protein
LRRPNSITAGGTTFLTGITVQRKLSPKQRDVVGRIIARLRAVGLAI